MVDTLVTESLQLKQTLSILDGFSLVTPQSIAGHNTAPNAAPTARQISVGEAELALVLMLAEQAFATETPIEQTMRDLTRRLQELRDKSAPPVWRHLASLAQAHSVARFLLQDPLTNWSFSKPRGYSGDAQLLDFIYEHETVANDVASASDIGGAIYDFTRRSASAVAVRERRAILSSLVDDVAGERRDAEVLAIAAGHLREAEKSDALRSDSLGRWVALDQDPVSVQTIQDNFQHAKVEAVQGSVRDILRQKMKLGSFDLIYAAGLYDYLTDDVAVRLTERCLELLKPGGKFVLANFASDIGVEGYMETFMNWPLLWRSEGDVRSIISNVRHRYATASLSRGENGAVIYATITMEP